MSWIRIWFLVPCGWSLVGAVLFLVLTLTFPLLVALTAFEAFVALLQAYIFTILAGVYIGGALHPEHLFETSSRSFRSHPRRQSIQDLSAGAPPGDEPRQQEKVIP